ncbi:alkaline phosphatase [Poriferisphaera sp. WC338]|uniref:alkaline phosphatase n=1 Tax=Poriferisphaera sp. WC338 TaxID=3425129 RepID=UPI003D815FB4
MVLVNGIVKIILVMMLFFGVCAEGLADELQPKNIIVMVADGSGYNTLEATRMYTGKPLVMDSDGWISLPMATYSLARQKDTTKQDESIVYDPAKAWDTTPVEGEKNDYPFYFEGYKWHMSTYPDSAATMSAMMTGCRVCNGSLNVDGNNKPLLSAAELAHQAGKAVGSISTVEISGATPAAGAGVHMRSRADHIDIANQMLDSGIITFIGGAGNPDYNNNGELEKFIRKKDYKYVGGAETWQQLKDGTHPKGWVLLESRDELKKLASTSSNELPDAPIIFVGQVRNTFQFSRKSATDHKTTLPDDDPFNKNVPTLGELTSAALNVLARDEKGFFLVVEGGAVDKAMHANAAGRMVEEYIDFNGAVKTVVDYLDDNTDGNNWDNTLLIVTADHDHLLFGPQGDKIPFQPLVDNGPGKMPGYKWFYRSHSNRPVPFFAKGIGAEVFPSYAINLDQYNDGKQTYGFGKYMHQVDMGKQLHAVLKPQISEAKEQAALQPTTP